MNNPNHTIIAVEDVNFSYHGKVILKNISIDIEKNRITGLIGPNGAGKSTLLRIITKLLKADSGKIFIEDKDINTLSRKTLAQRIATIPQESVFSFPYTVLEAVLMGRHPHHSGLGIESNQDVDIAMQALTRCGAEQFAKKNILDLSSGERQRVILARALAQEASILIMDEPSSFLDIRYQLELYDLLRELVIDSNCSVLTVMHDLNMAANYCEKLFLLKNGQVHSSGVAGVVLTKQNIKETFDADVHIGINPVNQSPLIIPISRSS